MATVEFMRGVGNRPTRKPLAEYALVRLVADVIEQGRLYKAGTTGTIVHIHGDAEAYEVEVDDPTPGVVTVAARGVEAVAG